jgi:isoleucyl-tRNA synthetase
MDYCIVKYKEEEYLLVARSRREYLEKTLQSPLPIIEEVRGTSLLHVRAHTHTYTLSFLSHSNKQSKILNPFVNNMK